MLKIPDQLQLVGLVILLCPFLRLGNGLGAALKGLLLCYDPAHLRLNLRQVIISQMGLTQVHVVVEAVFDGRTDTKLDAVAIEATSGGC